MTNPEQIEPDWATKRPPAEAFQIVRDAVNNPEVAKKVEQLEEERILSMTHGKTQPPEFKVLARPAAQTEKTEKAKPWWKKLEDKQYGEK